MSNFVLTKQHIEKASAYLPISVKAALAQTLAEQCVEAVEQNDVPPVYRLNTLSRELCLSMVLLKHYLKVLPEDDNFGADFGTKDFDIYMPAVWDYEITSGDIPCKNDFERFTAMLDSCIQSELAVRNDPCTRTLKMMTQMTTPESIQQAISQIQTLGGE